MQTWCNMLYDSYYAYPQDVRHPRYPGFRIIHIFFNNSLPRKILRKIVVNGVQNCVHVRYKLWSTVKSSIRSDQLDLTAVSSPSLAIRMIGLLSLLVCRPPGAALLQQLMFVPYDLYVIRGYLDFPIVPLDVAFVLACRECFAMRFAVSFLKIFFSILERLFKSWRCRLSHIHPYQSMRHSAFNPTILFRLLFRVEIDRNYGLRSSLVVFFLNAHNE